MADNIQHEDFGEKIGGAKKDLWKDRGLYVNDLDAMNEREAEKFVKKDNIWKKPDYEVNGIAAAHSAFRQGGRRGILCFFMQKIKHLTAPDRRSSAPG